MKIIVDSLVPVVLSYLEVTLGPVKVMELGVMVTCA